MLRLLVLVCCVVGALCAPRLSDPTLDCHWTSFKNTFGKLYSSVEEGMRRMIWEKNLAFIRNHNLEADMGEHPYTLGMNEHGDLTNEEYSMFLKGYKMSNETRGVTFIAPSNVEYPEMADWRKEGYVTPVKNQKQCGSCWAFSATGSLEGQNFKKSGKLVSLSEQNLVDCSKKFNNNGCHGGIMENAFKYIKANGGIDTEASYPYTAKDGMCHFKKSNIGATDTGFTDIPRGDEDALLKAAATVGPISVAIDASKPTFRFYRNGVYYDKKCSSKQLDHGVLVVGYGEDNGDKYWIVKNSWGATWGNKGYIWMSRARKNNCGIATQACYPLV